MKARLEYLRDAYRIRESEFLGFDAMRNAAQCVGRVLRGKTDWGLMVFADKVCAAPGAVRGCRTVALTPPLLLPALPPFARAPQRFARADKRAKLPRWINQYITETASNLSTDMALTLSKQFMRMISQNPNENQTGISLWTLEDIERAQAKQRELALAQATTGPRGGDAAEDDEDDDEYGDGGIDDEALAGLELDV